MTKSSSTNTSQKTLVSFPSSRKYRFYLNKRYLVGNFDIIGIESPDHFFGGRNVLTYPKEKETLSQKLFWILLKKIDRMVKIGARAKRKDFDASKHRVAKWLSFLINIRALSYVFEFFMIKAFRDKKYDDIVCRYDRIELFTLCYISELYLYSAALKNKKEIFFSIDGWDIYEYFWIPSRVTLYESWGLFFDEQLQRIGIEEKKILRRNHPFRRFPRLSGKYFTIYESPERVMSITQQIFLIGIVTKFATRTNSRVRVKCLAESKIERFLIDLNVVDVYRTNIEYTDHARSVLKLRDELGDIVPDTIMFISFGLSHGLLEFGVSGIPVLCFQRTLWESQGRLNSYLERCGVTFLNTSAHVSEAEIFKSLKTSLMIRPDFDGFLYDLESPSATQ